MGVCFIEKVLYEEGEDYRAFFHVNPDYAYWYRWAMMVKELDHIKELSKTMRATAKLEK